jgi:hypothetical protein
LLRLATSRPPDGTSTDSALLDEPLESPPLAVAFPMPKAAANAATTATAAMARCCVLTPLT